ncbi:MAG: heavy metal translocating P-type ATPase [Brevinematales bacterium]|nr:heavy metal translocating P-type ATPase [Brevinematales bacterium]
MQKYYLKNLDCADCAANIENTLKNLDFVKEVSIDFGTLSMNIETKNLEKVKEEIKKIDPKVEILEKEEEFNPKKEILFISILLFSFISLLFIKNKLTSMIEFPLMVAIYLLSGFEVFKASINNLKSKKFFDENIFMTIASLGAIFIGEVEEAVGVMLFYKFGKFFENLSVNHSRKSIKKLLELKPEYANLKKGKEIIKVAPEEVKVGDEILVKPGEKIPLDGIIIEGKTLVDFSPINGESIPKSLAVGNEVLAGTINKNGLITVKVTKLLKESSISKILELIQNAVHKKAKTELFFTRFASFYTPIVVLISILVATIPPIFFKEPFSVWIYRGLVVLVISCPCALVISIPLSYFAGIGISSRKGILLKGSDCIDKLNNIENIFFDKTGTITKGKFKVKEIIPENDFTKEEILEYAAKAEFHSNHPIAISIKEKYGKNGFIAPTEYKEIEGEGIFALIENKKIIVGNDKILHHFGIEHKNCEFSETTVNIAIDNKYAGYITIGDEIKEETQNSLLQLKKLNIKKITILSGDNKKSTEKIANELGVNYIAELLPEDKAAIIEKHKNSAFVGDGINDSPSLAMANPGIAMGKAGTDIAIEYADVVLMDDNLEKVPLAIKIARKTRKIVIENIIFALTVKIALIGLGLFGFANMWEAVFGDVGVAILATFNSLRILRS